MNSELASVGKRLAGWLTGDRDSELYAVVIHTASGLFATVVGIGSNHSSGLSALRIFCWQVSRSCLSWPGGWGVWGHSLIWKSVIMSSELTERVMAGYCQSACNMAMVVNTDTLHCVIVGCPWLTTTARRCVVCEWSQSQSQSVSMSSEVFLAHGLWWITDAHTHTHTRLLIPSAHKREGLSLILSSS